MTVELPVNLDTGTYSYLTVGGKGVNIFKGLLIVIVRNPSQMFQHTAQRATVNGSSHIIRVYLFRVQHIQREIQTSPSFIFGDISQEVRQLQGNSQISCTLQSYS